jgi:hypothetical protein
MKNIFFFLLMLFSVDVFSQALANPQTIGQPGRNQRVGEGLVVEDTGLFKGKIWIPLGAGSGLVFTSDASGFGSWGIAVDGSTLQSVINAGNRLNKGDTINASLFGLTFDSLGYYRLENPASHVTFLIDQLGGGNPRVCAGDCDTFYNGTAIRVNDLSRAVWVYDKNNGVDFGVNTNDPQHSLDVNGDLVASVSDSTKSHSLGAYDNNLDQGASFIWNYKSMFEGISNPLNATAHTYNRNSTPDSCTLSYKSNSNIRYYQSVNYIDSSFHIRAGNFKIDNGHFKYVDGNQTNGYVLTSDASGNASWQALSTGVGWTVYDLFGEARIHTTDDEAFVGIGTNVPLEKLHVVSSNPNEGVLFDVDTSTFLGVVSIKDGSQGSGKVLTSDASGNASWQSAAGGGWTDSAGFLFPTNLSNSVDINTMDSSAYFQFSSNSTGSNSNVTIGGGVGYGGVLLQTVSPQGTIIGGFAMSNNTGHISMQNGGNNGKVAIGQTVNDSINKLLSVFGTVKIKDGTQGQGKVLTSDASGNASWQNGEITDSIRISSAQFLDAHDTPIQILPAPVGGSLYIVKSIILKYNFGGVAYVSNAIYFTQDGSTSNSITGSYTPAFGASEIAYMAIGAGSSGIAYNTGITMYVDTTDPITGNGTFDVIITYSKR